MVSQFQQHTFDFECISVHCTNRKTLEDRTQEAQYGTLYDVGPERMKMTYTYGIHNRKPKVASLCILKISREHPQSLHTRTNASCWSFTDNIESHINIKKRKKKKEIQDITCNLCLPGKEQAIGHLEDL